jgi:hypothetical protein
MTFVIGDHGDGDLFICAREQVRALYTYCTWYIQFDMRAARVSVAAVLLIANIVATVQSWSIKPDLSRRDVVRNSLATIATLGLAQPALAAASAVPSAAELQRLQLGHARVRYLLEHWDEVTSVCGTAVMSDTERKQVIRTEGGQQCLKTPLRVQEFMGYKSTGDPLYRVDKLMVRAGPLVDVDDFENYLDTVERYREKADSTALLAYTSSWGEANP